MFAQNYLQVTNERAERKRRYDNIEGRAHGAGARGKAPSRKHFRQHRTRFVDKLGRVYILPVKGDRRAQHFVDKGQVGNFFDPEYLADAADLRVGEETERNPVQSVSSQNMQTLRGSVFMYVWRPKSIPHVDQRTAEPIPAMPPPRGTAGAGDEDFFLYECDSSLCPVRDGATYKVDVVRVESKRRSQRGQVILNNVVQIN